MTEKIKIPAVHDDDLKLILKKYHLFEKIEEGEITCVLCNDTILWDNIYGVFLEDNTPKLICSSVNCIEQINNIHHG